MKSSSDGPSVSVSVKLDLFEVDGLEAAGVARERAFLDTAMRTTRECLRIADIGNSRSRTCDLKWAKEVGSTGPLFLS